MSQVLVLDVSYQPKEFASWKKVVVWMMDQAVEVIDEHPDRYIRSASWSPKMPSIVRLLTPVPKKRAVKFSRNGIYARDNGRCQYCGIFCSRNRNSRNPFTIDHVLPRSRGGRTEWTNVVVACVPCNQRKSAKTPQEAGMHLRSTPVKPKKLPETRSEIYFEKGMPASWQAWLRDAVYWNGELENDE